MGKNAKGEQTKRTDVKDRNTRRYRESQRGQDEERKLGEEETKRITNKTKTRREAGEGQ